MALGTDHLTGTTHDTWAPNIWASETLKARESNLVLAPLVKRFDRDVKSKGQTVEIPNLSNLTANAKVAQTQVTLNAVTETKTTITIDQHWESSVLIEDFADAQSAYEMAAQYREKAGYAIAEKIDSYIATAMAAGFSTTVGVASTPLTYSVILDAKQALDEAKAPMTERYLAVLPHGHRELLEIDEFVRYDAMGASGQPSGFKTGKVGTVVGAEVFMSQNLVATKHLYFHKEAYALAMQKEPKFEMQRKTEYLGDLVVCQALWGGAILRADHGVVVVS